MGGATLRAMAKAYGTDPADVRAAIGPSICQDCYEVSRDVISRFQEAMRRRTGLCFFMKRKTANIS